MTSLTPFQNMSLGHKLSSQVAIIRREFVDLTGDHFSAVVLNQLLYWTQRVKDFDLLLEEERSFHPECNVLPRHGWIYKTAPELIEETMLKASAPTMRKYLKHLVDQGWVEERPHPLEKWNKTTQYRVYLRKLGEDLEAIGHTLPDVFKELSFREEPHSLLESVSHEKLLHSNQNSFSEFFCSNEKNFLRDEKVFVLSEKNFPSKEKILAAYTYTETIPENTNREHAQKLHARENLNNFINTWERHVGQEGLQLTENRKRQLKSILILYFDCDLQQWEQFCERIKSSPFLMGQGPRKWHVTLDWILEEANLIKVLEGNFDDPEHTQLKKEVAFQSHKEKERSEILASIEDPTWKDWCIQVSHPDLQDSLSLYELKEIASAKFVEFDGKLVWIECDNQRALDRIEKLRLKLLSFVQKSFPKARNIRTQLKAPLTALPSSEGTQTISYPSTSQQGEHLHAQ